MTSPSMVLSPCQLASRAPLPIILVATADNNHFLGTGGRKGPSRCRFKLFLPMGLNVAKREFREGGGAFSCLV